MLKIQILRSGKVVEGSLADLKDRQVTTWIDIDDSKATELNEVAACFKVNKEELQKLLHPQKRPVLQDISNFTAVVFHAPEIQDQKIFIRPLLLLVSKEQKDFISIHDGTSQAIDRVNSYSNPRKIELFQKGSTALLFAILGEMMEGGFEVLDYLGEEIGRIEGEIFRSKLSKTVMPQAFRAKKDLLFFQRALASDREVISEIEKAYGRSLGRQELFQSRLLYQDTTELIELAMTYRDIVISAIEVHLSEISNNLNVVVKRLTAWGAIILIPSLIAGIFGMNFARLPFSHHPYGFWYMIGIMIISVVILYSYFKHNDWV